MSKQQIKKNDNNNNQKTFLIMETEELAQLEENLWRFKRLNQLHWSKKEKEALVTVLVLIIEEIQKSLKNKK